MTMSYVELHARSAFSFLEGASLPEELIERAAELEYSAIALLDAHGVYGAPRLHMAGRKAGLHTIVGAEVASAEGCRYPLLVESRTGYHNLCQLLTRGHLRKGRTGKLENPVVTVEELAAFAG